MVLFLFLSASIFFGSYFLIKHFSISKICKLFLTKYIEEKRKKKSLNKMFILKMCFCINTCAIFPRTFYHINTHTYTQIHSSRIKQFFLIYFPHNIANKTIEQHNYMFHRVKNQRCNDRRWENLCSFLCIMSIQQLCVCMHTVGFV